MKEDPHERARRLIERQAIEGLLSEDRAWLESHLGGCEDCERWANRTGMAVRALINVRVVLPSGLAAATSLRVRREAEVLHQRRLRNAGLVAGCALSWVLGVASAPLVWKVCAWLGARLDLPRVVWMLGFAVWWLLPASAVALLLFWQKQRSDREPAEVIEPSDGPGK
jgi:hypothetical protein